MTTDERHGSDDHWCGVFSWAELARRGFTQAQVRRMIGSGDLQVLRRGWYATAYAHPTVAEAVRAGGVCSCVSALRLHGVWVPASKGVHVRAREAAHRDGRGARFCKQYGRAQPEIYALDDLITALRHAVKCLDAEGVVVVVDSILHNDLLEECDVIEALASAPSRVRLLLDRCDRRAESGTETIMRLRLRAMGLPVRLQVPIADIGRVDLLVGKRLIIELDSVKYHDEPSEQRDEDRRRDAEALRRGYLPLRFSYRQVIYDWEYVLTTISDIIGRGDHLRAPVIAG